MLIAVQSNCLVGYVGTLKQIRYRPLRFSLSETKSNQAYYDIRIMHTWLLDVSVWYASVGWGFRWSLSSLDMAIVDKRRVGLLRLSPELSPDSKPLRRHYEPTTTYRLTTTNRIRHIRPYYMRHDTVLLVIVAHKPSRDCHMMPVCCLRTGRSTSRDDPRIERWNR